MECDSQSLETLIRSHQISPAEQFKALSVFAGLMLQ